MWKFSSEKPTDHSYIIDPGNVLEAAVAEASALRPDALLRVNAAKSDLRDSISIPFEDRVSNFLNGLHEELVKADPAYGMRRDFHDKRPTITYFSSDTEHPLLELRFTETRDGRVQIGFIERVELSDDIFPCMMNCLALHQQRTKLQMMDAKPPFDMLKELKRAGGGVFQRAALANLLAFAEVDYGKSLSFTITEGCRRGAEALAAKLPSESVWGMAALTRITAALRTYPSEANPLHQRLLRECSSDPKFYKVLIHLGSYCQNEFGLAQATTDLICQGDADVAIPSTVETIHHAPHEQLRFIFYSLQEIGRTSRNADLIQGKIAVEAVNNPSKNLGLIAGSLGLPVEIALPEFTNISDAHRQYVLGYIEGLWRREIDNYHRGFGADYSDYNEHEKIFAATDIALRRGCTSEGIKDAFTAEGLALFSNERCHESTGFILHGKIHPLIVQCEKTREPEVRQGYGKLIASLMGDDSLYLERTV